MIRLSWEADPKAPVARAVGETVSGCGRADLAVWVQTGGPLPGRLQRHLAGCPHCARVVRQANAVRTGLALLRTQRVPPHLTRRSGERALRMLRRAVRSSRAARRLLAIRPDLPLWRKAQIHVVRLSAGAVAAGLFLMLRMGTLAGFQGAHHALRGLGSVHWNRHIDPGHKWMGPFPLDPPGSQGRI